MANTASVTAALRRAGADPHFVEDPDEIDELDRVVVPGVGSFEAGMEALAALGVIGPLIDRIEGGRPTLLVCLGMQLLGSSSDESPGVEGLAIIEQHVGRFPEGVRTPQFGWNIVEPIEEMSHLETGYAYFANSFRFDEPPAGWRCAIAKHGGPFIAAMEREDVLACQFHPELSGSFGQSVIDRWIEGVDR